MSLNWLRFWFWFSLAGVVANARLAAHGDSPTLEVISFVCMLICALNAAQFRKFIDKEKKNGTH